MKSKLKHLKIVLVIIATLVVGILIGYWLTRPEFHVDARFRTDAPKTNLLTNIDKLVCEEYSANGLSSGYTQDLEDVGNFGFVTKVQPYMHTEGGTDLSTKQEYGKDKIIFVKEDNTIWTQNYRIIAELQKQENKNSYKIDLEDENYLTGHISSPNPSAISESSLILDKKKGWLLLNSIISGKFYLNDLIESRSTLYTCIESK